MHSQPTIKNMQMQEKVVHATFALYSKPFECFLMRNRPTFLVICSTPVLCGAWITNGQNLHSNFHAKLDLN